jgi:hypothetical protein
MDEWKEKFRKFYFDIERIIGKWNK